MRKKAASVATAGLAVVLSLSTALSQPAVAQAAPAAAAAKAKAKAAKVKPKLIVSPAKLAKTPTKPAATPTKPAATPTKPAVTPAKPAVTPAKSAATPAAADVLTATDLRMVAFVDSVMATLRKNAPAGAAPGTWKDSGTCWRCDASPALALAAVSALTGDSVRRVEAEQILDTELAVHQQANGAFGNAAAGSDIETMFFANTLGLSALLLRPSMDPAKYDRWSLAVARAADFLIANKNLSWYTNGNITIGNALTMALAARLTGQAKYTSAYETALTFAVSPPQGRWPGRGLVWTVGASKADGSDSKGYFTEEGYGNIGYDPEYTQVQLDHLAGLYLVTGDARVRTYLNALTNQLADRLNRATWQFDTSGGTRHPALGRKFPYDTGSLSVLANLGGRTDLASGLPAQADMFINGFASGEGDRLRSAFGWTSAMVIMSQPSSARLR